MRYQFQKPYRFILLNHYNLSVVNGEIIGLNLTGSLEPSGLDGTARDSTGQHGTANLELWRVERRRRYVCHTAGATRYDSNVLGLAASRKTVTTFMTGMETLELSVHAYEGQVQAVSQQHHSIDIVHHAAVH